MAEDDVNVDDIATDDTNDQDNAEQSNVVSPNKKIILIIIPIIILLIGVAALYFTGFLGGAASQDNTADTTELTDGATAETEGTVNEKGETIAEDGTVIAPATPPREVYFDLPDILVNLNAGTKKQAYLKVVVTIALPDAATNTVIESNMPRILDSFQVYLRELSVDEIQGSAGMFRLKEELVERINRIVSPSKINDVLFKEMLIQ